MTKWGNPQVSLTPRVFGTKFGVQAPQATKSFLWRAASESFATNLNLHKRKVVESPLCPICYMYPESVAHAIWTCIATQDVWSMSSRRIQKLGILNGSFKDILLPILNQLSPLEFTEVAITTETIRHRRNTWIFEQQFHSPLQVSKQVQAKLIAIGLWIENWGIQAKIQVTHSSQWSAPPPEIFKTNWDAAFDKGNSKVRIGVIIRDLAGLIIASLSSSTPLTPNPLLGKAVVALRAITLCAELKLYQIILEGDSLAVVQAVQHKEESWNSTEMVIRDIKFLLSKVREWFIQHIPWKINVIAHAFALSCSKDCILKEDYPPCIQHLF